MTNIFSKTILLLVTLFPVCSQGQDQPASGKRQIEHLMQDKIRKLKNGVLLVRLQTKENSISALRDAGNEEQASQVEAKQIAYNKEVIAAFRSEFKFCPAYFFPSQFSENIMAGNVGGVVFYNDSLQADPSIRVDQADFLTAEVGFLDPDTAVYYEDNYYYYGGKGLEEKESLYTGADMGFQVLKIMNTNFIQLRKPFPYYVRMYDSLPIKRNLSKAVAKMNKQLFEYYGKNSGKQ